MDVQYGFSPHLSIYSGDTIKSAFQALKEICKVFKNKNNKANHFPNIPVGWSLAFPKRCCQDFQIHAIDNAPVLDYDVTIESWENISNKIKLQNTFQCFSYEKGTKKVASNWLDSENMISQIGMEYYVVRRIKNSNFISTYDCTVLEFSNEFVKSDTFDTTVLNANVPLFLFTEPLKVSLELGLSVNNQMLSYSNMTTNVNCLKHLCETTYLALSQPSFSRYNPDLQLEYTDDTIFYHDKYHKSDFLQHQGSVSNIYQFLDLYISFPTKFAPILLQDDNTVLQLDAFNTNNFLYKVPRHNNRYCFLHNTMPLINTVIRPPFLLQMKNTYNEYNIEINEHKLSCLAILNEKANTNVLDFIETYETSFSPYPNQYLQFVITDNKNNIIYLHPNSLIMISIYSNDQ